MIGRVSLPCSSPKMPGLDFGRARSTLGCGCGAGLGSPARAGLRVGAAVVEPGSLAAPVRGLVGWVAAGFDPSPSVDGGGEAAIGAAGGEADGRDGAARGVPPSSGSLDDTGGAVVGGVAADRDWGGRKAPSSVSPAGLLGAVAGGVTWGAGSMTGGF